MNAKRFRKLRAKALWRIQQAIRPNGPPDEEMQLATLEALTLAAGAVCATIYRIPSRCRAHEQLSAVAIVAMGEAITNLITESN